GSPWQQGTMTLRQIDRILQQAKELGTIRWIYFEGGEPFLYHAILHRGARMAAQKRFQVGVVSNAYWATESEDALEWLRPFAGLIQDLSLSCDIYHGDEESNRRVRNARWAAEKLRIPLAAISIAQPGATRVAPVSGQLPAGESPVVYRGRAVEKLAPRAAGGDWSEFTSCPCEDLRNPGRVHVDPFGNVHICQGISIGNLFRKSLKTICAEYDPDAHPVTGPILEGGPAALARRYDLPHADTYADACHLCYAMRASLRSRFPEILTPDGMFGVFEESR
ncbi:MAG: hypothetical protein JSW67_03460, partial [Candidatus Latescibacterota bacterium]